VAFVRGGLAQWSRDKLPTESGPEDLDAVPALRRGGAASRSREEDDDDDGEGSGGVRLGPLRLPQLAGVFSR
jgi:hypothetical protein